MGVLIIYFCNMSKQEKIITEHEMQQYVSCNLEYIATSIARERAAKQMSVYELARLSGTSENTVHKIERGERSRIDTLLRVVRTLGISLTLL